MRLYLLSGVCVLLSVLGSAPTFGAEKLQLVPPERLVKYWLLSAENGAEAPNAGFNLDAPSCAAVSYVIGRDGSTSQIKVERIVPEGDLRKVALSVVRGLRYTAANANPGKDAVFTYVVLPFNLPAADSPKAAEREQRARVLTACKLEDFKLPISRSSEQ